MAHHLQKYRGGEKESKLPLDAIQELAKHENLKEYFKNSTQSEKERIITFLRTFNPEATVAAMFGVDRRTIERAVAHNRGIMDGAKVARQTAIAGLAESKAIEALQSLDIAQVPDERKGRLVKDLVDSADIANQHLIPKSDKKEENTMELIFRIKQRGQQLMKKPDDDLEENVIDAEEVEPKQIEGGAP